jgi:hypothetical protein
LQWYDLYPHSTDAIYLPLAHLRIAQISERLGRNEDAARHYRRFIDFWKDCDPELRPLVTEARSAVARVAH